MNKITFFANNSWITLNLDLCVDFHTDQINDTPIIYVMLPSGNEITYEVENNEFRNAIMSYVQGDQWDCNPLTNHSESGYYIVLTKNNMITAACYDSEHSCFHLKREVVKVYKPLNNF